MWREGRQMKTTLMLLSVALLCGVAYAQAPGPAPAQTAAPLSQEDAIGAEMGRTLVRIGIYRWENEQLRTQVAGLTAQVADRDAKLAAAKAEADSLRAENEK